MVLLFLSFVFFVSAAAVDQKVCFTSNTELRQAVRSYVGDPSPENEVAEKYGWPMGVWCVDAIQDFSNVFTTMRTFNDDLSGWNMSAATSLYRMFDRAERFNQDLSSWGESMIPGTFIAVIIERFLKRVFLFIT
jgi:hypothetical protein